MYIVVNLAPFGCVPYSVGIKKRKAELYMYSKADTFCLIWLCSLSLLASRVLIKNVSILILFHSSIRSLLWLFAVQQGDDFMLRWEIEPWNTWDTGHHRMCRHHCFLKLTEETVPRKASHNHRNIQNTMLWNWLVSHTLFAFWFFLFIYFFIFLFSFAVLLYDHWLQNSFISSSSWYVSFFCF